MKSMDTKTNRLVTSMHVSNGASLFEEEAENTAIAQRPGPVEMAMLGKGGSSRDAQRKKKT